VALHVADGHARVERCEHQLSALLSVSVGVRHEHALVGDHAHRSCAGKSELCATAAVSWSALANARHEVDALWECARFESCDHERAARVCGDLGCTTTAR
jgi:hypothetical protein